MPQSNSSNIRSISPAVQLGLHALAVVWLGVMAGFFGTYSANVNLAMLQMDGPTYAIVQSAFNRNVRHSLFFIFFFSPPLLCFLAALAAWGAPKPRASAIPWCLLAIGVVYAIGIVFFTAQVNLPLNRITEAWNPSALPENWSNVRKQWNNANLIRAWVSFVCFVCATALLAWRAASECIQPLKGFSTSPSKPSTPSAAKLHMSHHPRTCRSFRAAS